MRSLDASAERFRDSHTAIRRGSLRALPVLAHGVSTHAQGLRLRGAEGQLALVATFMWPSPCQERVGTPKWCFRSSMAGLRVPLSFASPATLRSPAPDSGPRRCATPFLCGSFIRDSMPVYPGAFPDTFLRPFLLPPQRKRWLVSFAPAH